MKQNKELVYWYSFLGLLVFAAVLWFVIDFINSKRNIDVPKEYAEVAKPIRNSFNTEVFRQLETKKIVSNIELANLKTYTSIINTNSVIMDKIVEPEKSGSESAVLEEISNLDNTESSKSAL